MQYDFQTSDEAREQIQREVDVPARESEYAVGKNASMYVCYKDLENDRLTNIYDFSFPRSALTAKIHVASRLSSVTSFLAAEQDAIAVVNGAFLYLTDITSGEPRQSSMNLALQEDGFVPSLPVVDREALIADKHGMLSARHVRAWGELAVNGQALTLSGSRINYPTDCKVFGNGNVIIRHAVNTEVDARKQRIRKLEEASRLTP